jgi:hypothetical protein
MLVGINLNVKIVVREAECLTVERQRIRDRRTKNTKQSEQRKAERHF